jgi:streptomycin 6-kinase
MRFGHRSVGGSLDWSNWKDLDVTAGEGSCAIGGYLARWNLELEGAPWSTPSSQLARVRHRSDGSLALLKVPLVEEERLGSKVLHWWSGDGAVPVQAIDAGGAIVMEHAQPGRPSLLSSAESAVPPCWAADTGATATLVAVTQRLHRHQPTHVPEGLVALRRWFRDLFTWADQTGGYFTRAAAIAEELLDHQHDPRVLHGDIHHQNVLWFGPERGWLAIDPKGLYGDPAFDYANLLTNPGRQVILRPGRFDQHVDLITSATGIDRHRLLRWTVAWAGLSAAWHRMPELDGRAADVVEIGLLAERAISEWPSSP